MKMKKFVAYVAGISILIGGYHLYRLLHNTDELIVTGVKPLPTITPIPTYEPTYIIHNTDGTINFKADLAYLNERDPQTTPQTIIVKHSDDGSINFSCDNLIDDENDTNSKTITKKN